MTKAKRLSGKVMICQECGNGLHLKPHPQQKAAGMQINWNPKFKTLCWKIGSSFIKQKASKAYYRALYDQERLKIDKKYPGGADPNFLVRGKKRLQHNPKHHFEHAKRVAVKQFLGHLWLAWRAMEDMTVREPFRPKGEAHIHILSVPEVDEGELPKKVTDMLIGLQAKAHCYPDDLKNTLPRVDKSPKDDAETQELNEAGLDEDTNDDHSDGESKVSTDAKQQKHDDTSRNDI